MYGQTGQGGASWLPDPTGRFERRFWDGTAWTTAVMTGDRLGTDVSVPPPADSAGPLDPGPPAPPQPVPLAAEGPLDRHTSLAPADATAHISRTLEHAGWSVTTPEPGRCEARRVVRGRWAWSRRTERRATIVAVAEPPGAVLSVQTNAPADELLGSALAELPW
jgi:hypothetical protein